MIYGEHFRFSFYVFILPTRMRLMWSHEPFPRMHTTTAAAAVAYGNISLTGVWCLTHI